MKQIFISFETKQKTSNTINYGYISLLTLSEQGLNRSRPAQRWLLSLHGSRKKGKFPRSRLTRDLRMTMLHIKHDTSFIFTTLSRSARGLVTDFIGIRCMKALKTYPTVLFVRTANFIVPFECERSRTQTTLKICALSVLGNFPHVLLRVVESTAFFPVMRVILFVTADAMDCVSSEFALRE